MLIDGSNANEVKSQMVEHLKAGYKWVAFNPYRVNVKEDIHYFKELPSVINHCEKELDFFKPISNVLRSLDVERYEHCKKIDLHVLSNEILRLPIEPFKKSEELHLGLANGELYPVLLKRQIIPDEISNYKIYEHKHPGHQVYEIGHELDLAASFSTYKEANNFFEQHLVNCSALVDRAKPDLTLIAEFKHQSDLDVEGIPMYNSALRMNSKIPQRSS